MPEKELTTDELIEKIRKKRAEIAIVVTKHAELETEVQKLVEKRDKLVEENTKMMDELKQKTIPSKEDIQEGCDYIENKGINWET